MKRILFLTLSLMLLLSACSGLSPEAVQEQRYQAALAQAEDGHYAAALSLFRTLDGYRDANDQRRRCAFAVVRTYIQSQGSSYTPVDDSGAVVAYSAALVQPARVNRFAALDQRGCLVLGCGASSERMGSWVYTITLDENSSCAKVSFLRLRRLGTPAFFQGEGTLFLTSCTQGAGTDLPVTVWQQGQEEVTWLSLSDACTRWDFQTIQTLPADAARDFLQATGVTLADLGFTRMDAEKTNAVS